MTDFDRTAIAKWCAGFALSDDGTRFEGTEGIPPDVWDRLQRCAENGRAGFYEILAIIGRRGSKGLLGAVLICDLVIGVAGARRPKPPLRDPPSQAVDDLRVCRHPCPGETESVPRRGGDHRGRGNVSNHSLRR